MFSSRESEISSDEWRILFEAYRSFGDRKTKSMSGSGNECGEIQFLPIVSIAETPMDDATAAAKARLDRPTGVYVTMSEGKILSASCDEEKVIFTDGICGCQALAMLVEMEDGTRSVLLQHYPPIHFQAQERQLQRFLQGVGTSQVCNSALLLLVPSRYVMSSTGKFEAVPYSLNRVSSLTHCAQTIFPSVSVEVVCYSMALSSGDTIRHLAIQMLADGSVRYQAWCGVGNLN